MGAHTLLTFDMSVDFMWNTLKQKTRQDDDIDGAGDGAGLVQSNKICELFGESVWLPGARQILNSQLYYYYETNEASKQ